MKVLTCVTLHMSFEVAGWTVSAGAVIELAAKSLLGFLVSLSVNRLDCQCKMARIIWHATHSAWVYLHANLIGTDGVVDVPVKTINLAG